MSGRTLRLAGAVLVAGVVASGCGTQARWVNCEGRLQPINLPAPKAEAEPANEGQESTGQGGP